MDEATFVKRMSQYMPEPACKLGYKWLSKYPSKLRITKPRNSKLGDFRIKDRKSIPAISVNGDLNPYSFTITFTHEVAHLIDWTERLSLKNPHGDSWKSVYVELLNQLQENQAFPPELVPIIDRHIKSPKAASCSDPILLEELRKYDSSSSLILKEIHDGAKFRLKNSRVFERGELRRTRYMCTEVSTGRVFLVHGQSEVELVNP
ncbi:MAG: hypothetical protein R2813_00510 [Flavobacteriales bacterium]